MVVGAGLVEGEAGNSTTTWRYASAPRPGSRPSVWLSCTKGQLALEPQFQGLRKVASEVRRLRDRTGRGCAFTAFALWGYGQESQGLWPNKACFHRGPPVPLGGGLCGRSLCGSLRGEFSSVGLILMGVSGGLAQPPFLEAQASGA